MDFYRPGSGSAPAVSSAASLVSGLRTTRAGLDDSEVHVLPLERWSVVSLRACLFSGPTGVYAFSSYKTGPQGTIGYLGP